ncbi:MAG: WYL domain-containing protein [Bacteroidales bacterium]|nr:WYL domain-containing protein [Bacteroidales bacterium]
MSKNKDALIRYRVINKMLIGGNPCTLVRLTEACRETLDLDDLSTRTVEGDISKLRNDEKLGYLAPIITTSVFGERAYYYSDPEYSIDHNPLQEDEVEAILFAARLLEQFDGIEIFKRLSETAQRLRDAVQVYQFADPADWAGKVDFEKVDQIQGSRYLNSILDALKNRQVLKIWYKKFFKTKEELHVVHPYLLKEYHNRWYLIGYNPARKGIRSYGLDRIESMLTAEKEDFIEAGFNGADYYRNVIGVSVIKGDPVDIRIAFSKKQARYVMTQPLHHSQKEIGPDGDRIVFSFHLVPNFEFYAQILSWGAEVEVLEPTVVRKQVLKLAEGIVGKYRG